MANALIHILGSRSGYTTLDATPGLSAADRAELEVLGFGDATSSEAMARLETHACMVGRRLRTGRFAISRMLPGGTDDKGRPTIEVVSLVLDAAGYAAVAGALGRLAADARFWRLARGAVSRGYELPEESSSKSSRDPSVLRAFDTWVAARRAGGIGVLSPQDADGLLAMIALLDGADLGDCRWGVGVVSLSAPVDICTLAPSTAPIGSRPVIRAAAGAAWLAREMPHVEAHVAQNPLLPQRAALETAVRIEPALGAPARATPIESTGTQYVTPRPTGARNRQTLIAALCAAASLAVLAMTTAVYVRTGRAVNVAVEATEEPVYARSGLHESTTVATAPTLAGAYPPPSPPTTDRDGAGLQDATDPCPDQTGLVRVLLFEDVDADADGNAFSAGREFCLLPAATSHTEGATRFVNTHTDQCDTVQGVFLTTPFYVDSDSDEVGSGAPTPFCVQPGTAVYMHGGVTYVPVGGDECPDVKGVKPNTFYLDTDGDGLGDPNEATKHCGSELSGRVGNGADDDDHMPAPSAKPKTDEFGSEAPKVNSIEAALTQMRAILSKCRDVQNEIAALQTNQRYWNYTSDLGAQLAELHKQVLLVLDLQKRLHAAHRNRSEGDEVPPHGFVAKLWPVCTSPTCLLNDGLVSEWREVLAVLLTVISIVDGAEQQYVRVERAQGFDSPGINDNNPRTRERKVREAFTKAKRDWPAKLLDASRLQDELESLDRRERGSL